MHSRRHPWGCSRGNEGIELSVPGLQLEQRVTILCNAIEERDLLRYLEHAQHLYASLIQPLEAELASGPIRTLVFVPDGPLRLLPWTALHDGQRLLIETSAVAITPSLTLTEPRPLPRDKGRLLAAEMAGAEGIPSGLFSRALGSGPGGNVCVEAPHIQLSDGGTITADSAGAGAAGDLQILAGDTLQSHNSRVATAAARAGGGAIALRGGRLVRLRDRYTARPREGEVSSLVERGRDGVPANPEGVLPSRLYRAPAGATGSTSELAIAR
jgi:hypothetical protein